MLVSKNCPAANCAGPTNAYLDGSIVVLCRGGRTLLHKTYYILRDEIKTAVLPPPPPQGDPLGLPFKKCITVRPSLPTHPYISSEFIRRMRPTPSSSSRYPIIVYSAQQSSPIPLPTNDDHIPLVVVIMKVNYHSVAWCNIRQMFVGGGSHEALESVLLPVCKKSGINC